MEFIIRNHKTSDLLLNLMTIFNKLCIFYHIFLMLCCGILLREIPSSMSNYLWHQRGVISFRVRGMEVSGEWFGKSRVPTAGLASSQMARFSWHLWWGVSELPHLLQLPEILFGEWLLWGLKIFPFQVFPIKVLVSSEGKLIIRGIGDYGRASWNILWEGHIGQRPERERKEKGSRGSKQKWGQEPSRCTWPFWLIHTWPFKLLSSGFGVS